MCALQLYPHEAARLQTLGIRGNHGGKRGTYLAADKIAAVKEAIEQGLTYNQIMIIHCVSPKTITKCKRGEYDGYI